MATKKDLVEAHAFSRRRLVTAFVSGAPGGREVEPVRPGRVLIGGVALSVLLLAGAAIAGFLLGRPNSAWLEKGSFVISKDTGEQYVVLIGDGDADSATIQRVPNYLSAQLLLGQAELTPFSVKDTYIRSVDLGPDLGIDAAPAGLPDAAELIDSDWTACTAAGAGVRLSLPTGPVAEPAPGSAFVVSTGKGPLWLVAAAPGVGDGEPGRAYRFELPTDPTVLSTLLDRLQLGAPSQAPVVDATWLDLFPLGPTLDTAAFGVTRAGERAAYDVAGIDLSGLRIGSLVQTGQGFYLLADEGLQPLDPFAGLVYGAVVSAPQPIEGQPSADFAVPTVPDEWPETVPTAIRGGDLCAVLEPGADGAGPAVRIATSADPDASGAEVSAGAHSTHVDPAGGAYVQVGTDEEADAGSPYVVDAKGSTYALVGPSVAEFIGYGSVQAPLVPDEWMEYFDSGVPLSVNAARRKAENAPPA